MMMMAQVTSIVDDGKKKQKKKAKTQTPGVFVPAKTVPQGVHRVHFSKAHVTQAGTRRQSRRRGETVTPGVASSYGAGGGGSDSKHPSIYPVWARAREERRRSRKKGETVTCGEGGREARGHRDITNKKRCPRRRVARRTSSSSCPRRPRPSAPSNTSRTWMRW